MNKAKTHYLSLPGRVTQICILSAPALNNSRTNLMWCPSVWDKGEINLPTSVYLPTGRERARLTGLVNTFMMTGDKPWHATFLPWDNGHSAFLSRKSLAQCQAEVRPDRESDQERRWASHPRQGADRPLTRRPLSPACQSSSQPAAKPMSIPWQSISKFPNCFSWLPVNAQQPILTHIRRVKSPLNDGWICEASRFCFALCQRLVQQTLNRVKLLQNLQTELTKHLNNQISRL